MYDDLDTMILVLRAWERMNPDARQRFFTLDRDQQRDILTSLLAVVDAGSQLTPEQWTQISRIADAAITALGR